MGILVNSEDNRQSTFKMHISIKIYMMGDNEFLGKVLLPPHFTLGVNGTFT